MASAAADISEIRGCAGRPRSGLVGWAKRAKLAPAHRFGEEWWAGASFARFAHPTRTTSTRLRIMSTGTDHPVAAKFLERALLFTIMMHAVAMVSMVVCLLPGMPGGPNGD